MRAWLLFPAHGGYRRDEKVTHNGVDPDQVILKFKPLQRVDDVGGRHIGVTALYLHLGPFSRHVIRQIEQQLDLPQDISPHLSAPVEPPDVAITA